VAHPRITDLATRDIPLPALCYGTAWKEDATEACVTAALAAGFRGIDTANQRKHYHEAGVGAALSTALRAGQVQRDELFLQTKFTFLGGQDHRLPYDPDAPIADQVAQSFASSLDHLGVDRIDSLILHGPSQRDGLGPDDVAAWRAMEAIADSGRASLLGISNVTARQVADLVELARVAPRFVQNRCYASARWDHTVRAICRDRGIVYQGFSLLTANRTAIAHRDLRAIATRHHRTPAQIVFRFSQQIGMMPLTGTRDPAHMREDLAAGEFSLDATELTTIEHIAAP
jgi:diketogulonate reductase-like aldo/keto reductase